MLLRSSNTRVRVVSLKVDEQLLLTIISQQQDYAILVTPRSCKGCQR